MKRIIFVCHGSICRSPAAEFIAKDYVEKCGKSSLFSISSLAVSNEEIGNDVYPPMKRELLNRGIKLERHAARKITQNDYENADYIFYMDSSNKRYLEYLLDDHKHIIKPITEYTKRIPFIEDPWYSDRYSMVCDQITECIKDIFENIN